MKRIAVVVVALGLPASPMRATRTWLLCSFIRSILSEQAWEALQRKGRLRVTRRHADRDFLPAYLWMTRQMERRLSMALTFSRRRRDFDDRDVHLGKSSLIPGQQVGQDIADGLRLTGSLIVPIAAVKGRDVIVHGVSPRSVAHSTE